MEYCARIREEDGTFLVSFPDLPNINTYGDTLEEALRNAEEALNGVLEVDFERGFSAPPPLEHPGPDCRRVDVRPHIELAYRLRQLRGERSQKDLARQLGISYQAYQRLENPRKSNPTVKTLEKIARAYGKRIKVEWR